MEKYMVKTITLDSKTILVKSDNENDLSEIINFISKKTKITEIGSFLKFAEENRVDSKNYKFNRSDCYDR